MNFDQIVPIIYLVGVLILVLPSFLQSNSKLKQLLANLSVWVIIVLIVTTISYFLFKQLLFFNFIDNRVGAFCCLILGIHQGYNFMRTSKLTNNPRLLIGIQFGLHMSTYIDIQTSFNLGDYCFDSDYDFLFFI